MQAAQERLERETQELPLEDQGGLEREQQELVVPETSVVASERRVKRSQNLQSQFCFQKPLSS